MFDLSKAREVHRLCLDQLAKLKLIARFDEYEECYKDLLHRIDRILNKVKAALDKHPKKSSLLGQINHDRSHDDLLSYLMQARNCDEHTIADVTRREMASLSFNPAQGRGLFIENLTIQKDGIGTTNVNFKGSPAKITFSPAAVLPLPVTSRGVSFQLPKTHLGTPIDSLHLHQWLELGLDYYGKMLNNIEGTA